MASGRTMGETWCFPSGVNINDLEPGYDFDNVASSSYLWTSDQPCV